jgi:hypothetical protein
MFTKRAKPEEYELGHFIDENDPNFEATLDQINIIRAEMGFDYLY